MQIFQEIQKSFDWMGFNPKLKPFNRRILSNLAIAFTSVMLMCIFLIHEADTAQHYMESMYVVTSYSGVFLSFANQIFIAKKLFSLIQRFDKAVNEEMENTTTSAIFEKTNEFVEKWSKIGVFVTKYVVVPSVILPKFIISFFVYFTTDLGNDAFDLPVLMWFPYNWKNPTGYLMAVFTQSILIKCQLKYIECFILLAFGAFMFANTFVHILKHKLHSINKMANKKKSSQKNMYKKLSKFLRLHAKTLQIIESFSDLYEFTLTIEFCFATLTMCQSMLMVQIEISHNETNSIILLEAAVFSAGASIILLFVCELGQRLSNDMAEINDTINHLDWYLFPAKIQRVLLTVMPNTQKPVVIKCFGNILCAREQFKKVIKTIYSYFMTLREFYK